MAKKSKKNKNNNQHYFTFPDYERVTPEIRKVINEIKNPFIFSYLIGFLSLVAGVILVILARYSSSGLLTIYYRIIGYAGIAYCIGSYFFTIRKNIAFNKFKKKDEFRIIWIYSDKKYQEFYDGLKKKQSGSSSLRFLIIIGVLAFLTLLLFLVMEPQERLVAIVFGAICIGIIFVTGYLIPRSYVFAAGRKPYISLIDDHEAYALGRFYKWEKGYVKFRVLDKAYGIDATEMRFTYQEKSMFGKKTPTFQVLIPNNDQYTLQFARKEAKRINKNRKHLNQNPKADDDFMDKAFQKLIGSSEE